MTDEYGVLFSVIGVLVVVYIALAWILVKEAQKENQSGSKVKEELLKKEDIINEKTAAIKELHEQFEFFKKKNEELTKELASKETSCKELNERCETLKAQLEEKNKEESSQKPEDIPLQQDEKPIIKAPGADTNLQDGPTA